MCDHAWYEILEGTHKAVRDFARFEVETLSRKVTHRLQRHCSSGIFGDDYIYKTLWDEYCHEVQEGPHRLLEQAWELTLSPILDVVVEQIPPHAAALLTIFAAWELEEHEIESLVGSVWPDGIKRLVERSLAEQAGMRNLDHLGPRRDS